jgi:hypothetical protein
METVEPDNTSTRRPALRWMVVGVVAAAAILAAGWYVSTSSSSPRGVFPKPRGDQQARAELLGLLERADRTSWKIDVRFSRRLASGRSLSGDGTEINAPPDHLIASFGSLSGVYHGRAIDCSVTASGPNCSPSSRPGSPTTTTGPSTAARVRTVTGSLIDDYEVHRLPSAELARERARCFRLVATKSATKLAFGNRTDYCLAPDGVPLRLVTVNAGSTDRQDTTRVHRDAGQRDLAALILGFDQLKSSQSGSAPSTSVPSKP